MFRRSQQPTERELAALADGSLPAAKRVRVEEAVAASPQLQAIVAAQRRALAAIDAAAGERAPAALRARVELMREPAGRQSTARFRLPRLVPAGALAAAAVVAALVITLGGGVSAPTVAQAAVLANRPASAPAPPEQPQTGTLARLKAAGLPFPYWADRFGFRAVGVRHDTLNGRPATTVFYRNGDQRVAYTIVSGGAIAPGATTHRTLWNRTLVWTLDAHGLRVATWHRQGHSCVLAARNVPFSTLVVLAGWGDG